MFDLGASELLLIVIVAIVVIGPKDLPLAMRTAGRWIGKIRRVSGHFRSGIETMIREAELEEMEKKWKEQNEAVMREHPGDSEEMHGLTVPSAESAATPPAADEAESPSADAGPAETSGDARPQPQLPLPPP
jgi:sec-independent protein translocase protein TatB